MLLTADGLEPYRASAQAVVVGDLALTVAHAIPAFRGLRPTSTLVVSEGKLSEFTIVSSGVVPGESVVGRAYPVHPESDDELLSQMQIIDQQMLESLSRAKSFGTIADDWALLRLDTPPESIGTAFAIETGPVKPGMCVSVFRASPDGPALLRFDMTVVSTYSDDPSFPLLCENIVTLWNPHRVETDGWSGGFVGRQDESGRWMLIGILSASSIEDRLIFVSRPPKHILEWFARGGAGNPPSPSATR